MKRVTLVASILFAMGGSYACSVAPGSGGGDGGSEGGSSSGGSSGSSSGSSSGGGSGSSSSSSGSSSGMNVTSNCMPSNVVLNVAQSVPIQMGNSASNVAAGDVNGDNKADLVVLENAANAGSGVEVLVSNGDGTFQKGKFYPEAAASTGGFALGQFTGSARFDVAIDSFDNASVDNFVDILPSTGGGALGTPVSSNIGWENVFTLRVGDLNGDGKPDLVFTDQGTSGGDSGYALNSGGGMFGSSVPLSLKGDGYALGDVTGDNVADIVQVEDTSVCVYVNDGKGQLPAMGTCYPSVAQTMPDTIALGDIDGDKLNDVIAVYMGDSGVANGPNIDAYLNKGKGVLGTAQAANLPFILSNVQLVDVNNDKKADIVGFNSYSSGIVQVLLGKGRRHFRGDAGVLPRRIAVGERARSDGHRRFCR